MAQNGRDVFKNDALLWEIRHVADAGAEFVDHIGIHSGDASGRLLEVNAGGEANIFPKNANCRELRNPNPVLLDVRKNSGGRAFDQTLISHADKSTGAVEG